MLLLLDPYVDVILALALAYLSLQIVKALFGPLDGLPVVGAYIAKLDHAISQSVANACGTIVHPVDIAIGRSLAGIASLISRVGIFFRSAARVGFGTAELAAALAYAYHGVRSLSHDLTARFHGIDVRIRDLTKEWHGIEHRVTALENDLTKGIGHDLRATVNALDKELARVEHTVIPSLREAEAEAQTAISDLYSWARGKADLIGIGTFAGAVAIALTALGLGGLRCSSLLRSLGSRGCGFWSGLENLLGLFVDGILLTDLCAIIPETVQVFSLVEGELTGLIAQAADAICSKQPASWPVLNVAPTARPPAQTFDPTTL